MKETKKWYQKVPNAFVILFIILIIMSVLTYIVPSGEFQTKMMDNGRMGVIPGSFSYIEKTPEMTVSLWDIFRAIPVGMVQAGSVMMIVFLAGGMFKILEETRVIESSIGITIKTIEEKNISKRMTLVILTLIFGFFGAAVGYENLIPFVPLGIMVALGLGYDLMVGAAVVIGGLSVGFATSPINPYSVGVAQAIADLPTFSGMGLRTTYCSIALIVLIHHTIKYAKKIEKDPSKSMVRGISTDGLQINKEKINSYSLDGRGKLILAIFLSFIVVVVGGVIKYKWYLTEISALFLLYGILIGIVAKFDSDKIVNTFIKGASQIVGGALIIGFARAIKVILDQGKIGDTIINSLAAPLGNFTPTISAILMTLVQGVINFFIPSGSGQAMATMPIIVPLSDIIGVNRQVAVLAFQIGDGLINMVVPTLGGLLAMLALARIPFDKWFRFIIPLVIKLFVIGWIFIGIATAINWQ
ncbi:YfcC family protein [Clostridium sediminicola]|uniref:YfcC family protein n=1 Tax=Clostridium sediminicola TaxID=3114879 RepID=UPI0031F22B75